MNMHRGKSLAIAAITALFITACSSGGSEGTGANGGGGGGIPSAVSFGTVTQLGSVYVNDVHYVTSSATIKIDDNPSTDDQLKVGQVVVVSGSIDDNGVDGTASSVTVESVVKGPVDAVYNPTTRELGVLGQTIQVTDLTIIDDSLSGGVAGLNNGDEVKIHGHVRGNGIIEATLIEDSNVALTEYKVIGLAQSIDAPNFTFAIGNLIINYTTADVSDLSGGMPSAGQLVEVKGDTTLSANTLVATRVDPTGVTSSNNNAPYVEIEGFVTAVTATAPITFTIGNIPVTTTNSTIYEGGLPEDVLVGSKLEVDGQLTDGTLAASKVQFRYNVKIEGNVSTTDGNSTLTVIGLSGITINLDGLTEMDGSPAVDHEIRLRGYKTGSGTVTATRFEDRGASGDPTPRTILQAPVESEVNGTSITLLGITVNTTASGFEFRDTSDVALSSDAFYNLVDVGTLVKARGDYNDSTLVIDWDQAEVED
ncbi:DUF5666 domain-containing protein [Kaarinaea lacus]